MQGQYLLKQSKRPLQGMHPIYLQPPSVLLVLSHPSLNVTVLRAGDVPSAAAQSWAGLKGTPRT